MKGIVPYHIISYLWCYSIVYCSLFIQQLPLPLSKLLSLPVPVPFLYRCTCPAPVPPLTPVPVLVLTFVPVLVLTPVPPLTPVPFSACARMDLNRKALKVLAEESAAK